MAAQTGDFAEIGPSEQPFRTLLKTPRTPRTPRTKFLQASHTNRFERLFLCVHCAWSDAVRAHKAVSVRGAYVLCVQLCVQKNQDHAQACRSMEFHGTMAAAIPRSTMEEALAAMPDGQTLEQWREANDCGQSTAYALLKIVQRLGVPITRTRLAGATKASAVIEGQSADAMARLLAEFKAGKSVKQMEAELDAMEGAAASAIAPAAPSAIAPQDPEDNDPEHDAADLLLRLEAAQLAQQTGLPLTRKELAWILGSQPTTRFSRNARLRIEQHSARGWSLLPPED